MKKITTRLIEYDCHSCGGSYGQMLFYPNRPSVICNTCGVESTNPGDYMTDDLIISTLGNVIILFDKSYNRFEAVYDTKNNYYGCGNTVSEALSDAYNKKFKYDKQHPTH